MWLWVRQNVLLPRGRVLGEQLRLLVGVWLQMGLWWVMLERRCCVRRLLVLVRRHWRGRSS
jgi:hypothetical protein